MKSPFFEVCAQGVGRLSCFPGRTPVQLLDSQGLDVLF